MLAGDTARHVLKDALEDLMLVYIVRESTFVTAVVDFSRLQTSRSQDHKLFALFFRIFWLLSIYLVEVCVMDCNFVLV